MSAYGVFYALSDCLKRMREIAGNWEVTMDIRALIGEATDYDKKVILEKRKPKSQDGMD